MTKNEKDNTGGSQPYRMPFEGGDMVCDKPAMATNGMAMIVYDSENVK